MTRLIGNKLTFAYTSAVKVVATIDHSLSGRPFCKHYRAYLNRDEHEIAELDISKGFRDCMDTDHFIRECATALYEDINKLTKGK